MACARPAFFWWIMIRTLVILGLLFLFQANSAYSQITTQTEERLAITGLSQPAIVGSKILAESSSKPQVSKAVIVKVGSDYKFIRVKARRNGEKYLAESISQNEYFFTGAGKYLIEIVAFDPEKGIDEAEIEFEITGEPSKPDGPNKPDEPNTPDSPYDDLAGRVSKISKSLPPEQAKAYNTAMQSVIKQMRAREIKRVEEAAQFIKAQNLASVQLNRLLNDDASARGSLSFDEAILWYEQVEKGTR